MKVPWNTKIEHLTQAWFTLRNRYLFALDIMLFCLTALVALWLRTDGTNGVSGFFYLRYYSDALARYLLLAIAVRSVIFIPLGLYSRFWRYASVDELTHIGLAVGLSTILLVLLLLGLGRPVGFLSDDFPRSMALIDGLLVLLVVGGLRFSFRIADQTRQRRRPRPEVETRVIILGAGDAGIMIVKEMSANPHLGLVPVAFLDDDPRKHGARIQGITVVGACQAIREFARKYHAQQAIIAMPTAPGKVIRELTRLCQDANVPVKTVPGIFELLEGSVTVNQLRSVEITDLLRREPVAIEMSQVKHLLEGKHILVTGGGGSIGSELCRQIARCNPAQLILLGHGENSLFEISGELRQTYPRLGFNSVVADIRDANRLGAILQQYRPEVVFHAAAHKHVPLMEDNVEDAITNNVLGTRNVVELGAAHGVERLVLISTDKAVNPTSIMGATKRVAELLIQEAAQRTGRCFVAVRFGNVLGSRGSVVPLFKQQIAQHGPVTVTHPEVRRYFMTIPEAVLLVLQAAALGAGGEIFVLDMGQPLKIADLARDLIRLSGLEVGQDIDIKYTGLRPGEKLFEELFVTEESYSRTAHEKIFAARRSNLDVQKQGAVLTPLVNRLIDAAQANQRDEVRRLLQLAVPEFQPMEAKYYTEPATEFSPSSSPVVPAAH